MAALLSILRDGEFLSHARIRLWTGAILVGFAAGIAYLLVTAHGLNDYHGRPLGTDFSSFYAAGRLALDGQSPFDQSLLHYMQQAIFGEQTPYYAFSYPPVFLLIAAPLAMLPYFTALALWQTLSLALYLLAMARLRRRLGANLPGGGLFLVTALAFTATFINLTHGQNGFLSAALLALALSLLEENEWLAGACFGLLVFKPQLGLLVPFALAAGGYWRAFVSAAASVTALILLSAGLFGVTDWQDFLSATAFSQHAILDQDAVGYQKMISVFAWMRLWGAPLAISYLVQIIVALAVAAAVAWLWRSKADLRVKGAALCLGTLLVTPFAFDYDMMALAPAIVLLTSNGLANGFRAYERTLLAALCFVPIATRGFTDLTHVPLGAPVMLIVFAMAVRHGLRVEPGHPSLVLA